MAVYTSASAVFDGIIAAVEGLNPELVKTSDLDGFTLRTDDGNDSVEQVVRNRSWQLVPVEGPTLGANRCKEEAAFAAGFLHLDKPESLRLMLDDHAIVRPRLRALAALIPGVDSVKVTGPKYGYGIVAGACLVAYEVRLTYHVELVP